MEKNTRQSNVELLRLVLMLMIVLLHVFDNQITQQYTDSVFIMQSLISSFCIVGVNVFVFISGYFSIKLKVKSVLSIVLQGLFYSWLILGVYFIVWGNPGLGLSIKSIFPIMTPIWWFLTVYLVLMFIAPYLNKAIEILDKKQNTLIILGLIFFEFIRFPLGYADVAGRGYSIYHFIVIYCIARYMYKYKIQIRFPVLYYVIPAFLLFVLFIFADGRVGTRFLLFDKMFAYNNPLIIIASIGLFFTFRNKNFSSKIINNLAPLTFAVYLIHTHPLIFGKGALLIEYLTSKYQNEPAQLFLLLLALSILIFFFCLCIEKVRQLLFNPIVDNLSKKIEGININFLVNEKNSHEK